jgi:hypothetical protein
MRSKRESWHALLEQQGRGRHHRHDSLGPIVQTDQLFEKSVQAGISRVIPPLSTVPRITNLSGLQESSKNDLHLRRKQIQPVSD